MSRKIRWKRKARSGSPRCRPPLPLLGLRSKTLEGRSKVGEPVQTRSQCRLLRLTLRQNVRGTVESSDQLGDSRTGEGVLLTLRQQVPGTEFERLGKLGQSLEGDVSTLVFDFEKVGRRQPRRIPQLGASKTGALARLSD